MFRIIMISLLLLVGISSASTAEARSCVKPPLSLKGSPRALEYQNCMGDRLNLSRIKDDRQLKRFIEVGLLVPLPQNKYVKIDSRLKKKFRYCRPATRAFILEISKRFYAEFGKPLWINSAARTADYQKKLIKKNANAARGNRPGRRSPHLTGAPIDFGYKKLKAHQIVWLEGQLLLNEQVGRAEATKEKHQAVFHVTVFR